MITLDEAKALKPGDILIDNNNKRWKVNGQVKLWKTDPKRIKVPLKHGLYTYDYLGGIDFEDDDTCTFVTKEG